MSSSWNSSAALPAGVTKPLLDIPDNHHWVFGSAIGEGGNGTAYLWYLVDEKQNIIDRIVIKNFSIFSKFGMLRDGPGAGQLKEVYLSKILAPHGTPADEVFTAPILAAEQIPSNIQSWRIYMPYLAYGSLQEFLENQKTPVPEPFAWFLFYRLAQAAMAMDERPPKDEEEYVVVHLDLKPDNIFMDNPGALGKNSSFASYPLAYVGDFGNSDLTYHGDPKANRLVGWCTPNWEAPEIWHNPNVPAMTLCRWQAPAHSHTNIWQIGWIMLVVLALEHGSMNWGEAHKDQRAPRFENGDDTDYSDDLLWIIHGCVKFKTTDRPSPQVLVAAIEAYIDKHTDVMERWGTLRWFNEQMGQPGHESSDDESSNNPRKRGWDIEKAEQIRFGKEPQPDNDPYSIRKRRKMLVATQIRDGKLGLGEDEEDSNSPPFLSQVDEDFVLDDKYKVWHPKRLNDLNLERFFSRPDAKTVEYRPEIDDVDAWSRTLRDYERGRVTTPPDGWNFRLHRNSPETTQPARPPRNPFGDSQTIEPSDSTPHAPLENAWLRFPSTSPGDSKLPPRNDPASPGPVAGIALPAPAHLDRHAVHGEFAMPSQEADFGRFAKRKSQPRASPRRWTGKIGKSLTEAAGVVARTAGHGPGLCNCCGGRKKTTRRNKKNISWSRNVRF